MNAAAASAPSASSGALALAFQEPLTAIVRIRANRASVPSLDAFRKHIMAVLRNSETEAIQLGYPKEYTHFALYATVAFLDETAMESKNPALTDWVRRPLQPDWFKGLIAGRTFFQYLDQLLQAGDSPMVADVLEVYQLCLLLGYSGQFAKQPSTLRNLEERINAKIRRIRLDLPRLSEPALPKPEQLAVGSDWTAFWLAIAASIMILAAAVLYFVFRSSISWQIDAIAYLPALRG